jgi:phosphate transport system substrate-binding protein
MKALISQLFIVGSVCVGLIACNSSSENSQQKANIGKIIVAADESLQPLIDSEKIAYEGLYPDIKIIPHYKPELLSIQMLLNDSARVAVVSRELNQKEKDFLTQNNFSNLAVKIAVDAVALITNKTNKDTLIALPELKAVLTGEKSKWSDLKYGKSSEKIVVVFDNNHSSNLSLIAEKLDIQDKQKLSFYTAKSNEAVIDYVKEHKNALGVIGINWISDGDDPASMAFSKAIKVMGVSEIASSITDDYYQPFQYNLALQKYPLHRNIYMIMKDSRNSFVNFCGRDKGQLVVLKAGLLPATQPVRIVEVKK